MAGVRKGKKAVDAVGYLRTSSAANVGDDKDSESRQRKAIERYAKSAGFRVVDWFYDAAVSGTDAIQNRPGFAALLDRIDGNGVRTVIVEDASRFARQLMAQELGIALLDTRQVTLLTSSGENLSTADDPARIMIRQITGAFAQYEKARLVAKLASGRTKKRSEAGKCEGRKSHAELHPDVVMHAKRLRRASPRTGERRSLRDIAIELAKLGYRNLNGQPYAAKSVRAMLAQRVAWDVAPLGATA